MKYFLLERIDEKLLESFLHFLNNNPVEEITIVIDSVGGKSPLADFILSIINSDPERFTLASVGMYSAAFWIFANAICKKKISRTSLGMFHLSSKDMNMQSNNKPTYYEDEAIIKNWKEDKTEMEFAKSFMTKKELADFKRGCEVYFTAVRLNEIFPDVEIF